MFLFIMACGSRLSWCRKHVNPVQIIVRTFIYIYIYIYIEYTRLICFLNVDLGVGGLSSVRLIFLIK
jgi:hypothetical protein